VTPNNKFWWKRHWIFEQFDCRIIKDNVGREERQKRNQKHKRECYSKTTNKRK